MSKDIMGMAIEAGIKPYTIKIPKKCLGGVMEVHPVYSQLRDFAYLVSRAERQEIYEQCLSWAGKKKKIDLATLEMVLTPRGVV
jgi:hypothetical protein